MTSAIIAIVGVLVQFAIALYARRYANRVAKKANDDKLEAIEHEKIAVEVLHLAQELHEATTSDEDRQPGHQVSRHARESKRN